MVSLSQSGRGCLGERNTSRDSDRQAGRSTDKKAHIALACLQIYVFTNCSTLYQFLGLPVTIAHAGLLPFLVSFLVGFFVQVSNTFP